MAWTRGSALLAVPVMMLAIVWPAHAADPVPRDISAWLDRCEASAQEIADEQTRLECLIGVAARRHRSGDTPSSLRLIREVVAAIPAEASHSNVLIAASELSAELGDLATARHLATRVPPQRRDEVLKHLALTAARSGHGEAAIAFASGIGQADRAASAQAEVCSAVAAVSPDDAAALAAAFEAPATRAAAFAKIAATRSKCGDPDGADAAFAIAQVAFDETPASDRKQPRLALAKAYAEADRWDMADSLASSASGREQAVALGQVHEVACAKQDLERARVIAERVLTSVDPNNRQEFLIKLTSNAVAAGDDDGAPRVDQIEFLESRASLLRELAEWSLRRGNVTQAKSRCELARQVATQIQRAASRDAALNSIALVQIGAGDLEAAELTSSGIEGVSYRILNRLGRAELAWRQGQAERSAALLQGARLIIEGIDGSNHRSPQWATLAEAAARLGDGALARRAAAATTLPNDVLRAWEAAGRVSADRMLLLELGDWLTKAPTPLARHGALLGGADSTYHSSLSSR